MTLEQIKKCHRCKKQAVVFVGLADPDAMEYPMCKKCADQWKYDVIKAVSELK
jgi:transcription elongation factor Elf1